jgi:hypothetical protein
VEGVEVGGEDAGGLEGHLRDYVLVSKAGFGKEKEILRYSGGVRIADYISGLLRSFFD